MTNHRPFIQKFENETTDGFDVIVHHKDCREATAWTRNYFSLCTVKYLYSDFDANHTYRISNCPRSDY